VAPGFSVEAPQKCTHWWMRNIVVNASRA